MSAKALATALVADNRHESGVEEHLWPSNDLSFSEESATFASFMPRMYLVGFSSTWTSFGGRSPM